MFEIVYLEKKSIILLMTDITENLKISQLKETKKV